MIASTAALLLCAAPLSLAELKSAFAALETRAAVEQYQCDQPEIAQRLLRRMVEIDQGARQVGASDPKLWDSIDAHNLKVLKVMLAKVSWFDIARYGERADNDAWLIAQHADPDLPFQKDVLARLEKRVEAGQTSRGNYAYLYDRVATNEQRKQRYGTQGRCTGKSRWTPNPIEEPEKVDERRAWAEIFEPKLADYERLMSSRCP